MATGDQRTNYADRRINHVLIAIKNTHLSRVMTVARNLPAEKSDRFHDAEHLSRELFDKSHGESNLKQVNPDGQAIGVKCEECGEKWVTG